MLRIKVVTLITITFISISLQAVNAEVKTTATHSHNGRSHTHVLPRQGLNHSHGGNKAHQSSKNNFKNKGGVDKCDTLAAHPDDPQRKAKGVDFDRINISIALSACQKALNKFPNNGRYQYQYGRVLHKAKQYKQADIWLKKAARNGHHVANYNLGSLYEDHKYYQQAIQWYKKADIHGYSDASYALGLLYDEKLRDYEQAINWYTKSANFGNKYAIYNLGYIYYNNFNDISKSIYWFTKGMKAGDSDSRNALAEIYINQRQYPIATKLLLASAKEANPDPKAIWNLAVLYEKTHQYSQAEYWTKRAAAAGSKSAQSFLRQQRNNNSGSRGGMSAEERRAQEDLLYRQRCYGGTLKC